MTAKFRRIPPTKGLRPSDVSAAVVATLIIAALAGGWLVSSGTAYALGWYGHASYPVLGLDDQLCPPFPLAPAEVPRQIRIHTHLVTGDAPLVWQDMDLALAQAYPELPLYRDGRNEATGFRDGVLHLVMRIHVGRQLVLDGDLVQGVACRGHMEVAYPSHDPTAFRFAVVHETGHALGLCHTPETYMHPQVPEPGERRHVSSWSPGQEAFLAALGEPGAEYPRRPGPCIDHAH